MPIYQETNNAYILEAVENKNDKITVEVGDTKQPDFKPQVKLMRWDNEVNFSARLVDTQIGVPIISNNNNNEINWEKGDQSLSFSDIPINDEFDEGGYKFDLLLKQKPSSNRIDFTIQHKGLVFYYQPFLTEEEKLLRNPIRPENVEGSYAVYYENCPLNIEGGKEYRVGKVFHIYRPKIKDANGLETWGELNIDTTNNLMTVIIPQDFFDNARYPILVDPDFGYTGSGATEGTAPSNSYIHWNLKTATPASSGTVTGMSLVCKKAKSDGKSKCCIYKNSDKSFIGQTVEATITNTSKHTEAINISGTPAIDASTAYVMGFNGLNGYSYYYDTATENINNTSSTYSDSNYNFPSTLPTGSVIKTGAQMSIWATYTAGGGGTNMKINIGDVFKDVTELKINIGDTWKAVTQVKINIGDVWKTVFGLVLALLTTIGQQ